MSNIGWGVAGGVNNTPTASGYAVANTGTTDAFGQTAVCGVVGAYTTAVFSYEWIPAVAGELSAVGIAFMSYGGYSVRINQTRAAGTVRVSAVVDGVAAGTVCELTVSYSSWSAAPATYGGFSWAAVALVSKFWTRFIGTGET